MSSHVFINTIKSAFRPVYKDLVAAALPELGVIEQPASGEDFESAFPGGVVIPAAASIVEFIFWGRGDGYTPPTPADVQIVRWEQLTRHQNNPREDSLAKDVFIPVVVYEGSATFGGLVGIEGGLITDEDHLADEFTDTKKIEKSIVFSPNNGICGTISVDNHGCGRFSVFIDGAGSDGYNAGYRFW